MLKSRFHMGLRHREFPGGPPSKYYPGSLSQVKYTGEKSERLMSDWKLPLNGL